MSEDRRLKDKLAKLAAGSEDIADGARRLAARQDGGLFAAMLTEIDETILGRRITFRADDGRRLVAEVANRRLLRLAELPPGAGDDRLTDLLGPESDDILPAVIDAMKALADGETALSVQTAPLPERAQPDVLGRSASALAAAAGIELYAGAVALAPAGLPPGFAAEIASVALAVRVFGATPVGPLGPDADRLASLDEKGIADLAERAGTGGDLSGSFIVLSSGGEDAKSLFVGFEGPEAGIAALIPPSEIGSAIALWRSTRTPD